MKNFECPLCKKANLLLEDNLRLVTDNDQNIHRPKHILFHQYICPSCGFVALIKPPEEGEQPESTVSWPG